MNVKKKLLDLVRDKIRFKHYSYSTERTYVHWIKHYILFHQKKHPVEMGKVEIEQYLTNFTRLSEAPLYLAPPLLRCSVYAFQYVISVKTPEFSLLVQHIVVSDELFL